MLKFAYKAAVDEVAPFLRRIESALDEGVSLPEAYAESLRETTVLKRVVGEPVKGLPFSEGLLEGAKQSQLRPLIVFANQVKLREGGGEGLRDAVKKAALTTMRLEGDLQPPGRASTPPRTKKLILIGGAAAVSFLIVRRLRR
jgi:hypothetical protein